MPPSVESSSTSAATERGMLCQPNFAWRKNESGLPETDGGGEDVSISEVSGDLSSLLAVPNDNEDLRQESNTGISVPLFLRPLLGVDFVPYPEQPPSKQEALPDDTIDNFQVEAQVETHYASRELQLQVKEESAEEEGRLVDTPSHHRTDSNPTYLMADQPTESLVSTVADEAHIEEDHQNQAMGDQLIDGPETRTQLENETATPPRFEEEIQDYLEASSTVDSQFDSLEAELAEATPDHSERSDVVEVSPTAVTPPASGSKRRKKTRRLSAAAKGVINKIKGKRRGSHSEGTAPSSTSKSRFRRRHEKTPSKTAASTPSGRDKHSKATMDETASITTTTDRSCSTRSPQATALSNSLSLLSTADSAATPQETSSVAAGSKTESPKDIVVFGVDWLRNTQEKLHCHQSQLDNVHKETQRVQQRAVHIAGQIESIQAEAYELQRALDRSLQKLKAEEAAMVDTTRELEVLQDKAVKAAEAVQETVELLRGSAPAHVDVGLLHSMSSFEEGEACTAQSSEELLSQSGIKTRLSYASNLGSSSPYEAGRPNESCVSLSYDSLLSSQSHCEDDNTERSHDLREDEENEDCSCDGPVTRFETGPIEVRFQRGRLHSAEDITILPQQKLPEEEEEDTLPARIRANTEPLMVYSRFSYMRVDDLTVGRGRENPYVFLDHRITPTVLEELLQLGYSMVTDETDLFTPNRETEKLLKNSRRSSSPTASSTNWPVSPWHSPTGKHVYLWTRREPYNDNDWPVVKARGFVQTSARSLVKFLSDSTQVPKYNKISQGRQDIHVLQQGIDTPLEDSVYGFPGEVKFTRSLNKPRLLPRCIEAVCLLHTRQLQQGDSYIMLTRSVWEDDTGLSKCTKEAFRSHMLLGVTLVRPISTETCEITTITHVSSPGVPEMLAKKAAPGTACSMVKDIQAVFQK